MGRWKNLFAGLVVPLLALFPTSASGISNGTKTRTIDAGGYHTCSLSSQGVAFCWGYNADGELGDGTDVDRTLPTAVSTNLRFKSMSLGNSHTCALTFDGIAYCWGYNLVGTLGDGTIESRLTPTAVSTTLKFKTLGSGAGHTCALADHGAAYCWGYNLFGELGDGTLVDRYTPTLVAGSIKFRELSVGMGHACGISKKSGAAYCWGWNDGGPLGDGSEVTRLVPTKVQTSTRFMQIDAGHGTTCALDYGGRAFCWGAMGAATVTPVKINTERRFVSIKAGGGFSCALTRLGSAYCWGGNGTGQLGDGTIDDRFFSSPRPVQSVRVSFIEISLGSAHACGFSRAGEVYCWGHNASGQLGDGTYENRPMPVLVE